MIRVQINGQHAVEVLKIQYLNIVTKPIDTWNSSL
ncbi:hypothetical protein SAMN05216362_1037 [Piscibacillus halophilus]|uniref:Uncharacterized protein n=1 Tax=Piscibacillus halophilus TaxID=571933 RepID=A0A1H9APT5_9BACI|nr:hypothetical protein SAMN05216362_1037 [Piscibacillus halophilus]